MGSFAIGLLTEVYHLLFILPLILLCRLDKKSISLVLLFMVYYIIDVELMRLPGNFPELRIQGSHFNWTGKLLSIIWSVIFYLLFRKQFVTNDFITLEQKKDSVKPILIAAVCLYLFHQVFSYFILNRHMNMSTEALAFEISLPGLDEEFAFRGIILGLLATALPSFRFKRNIGAPALYITAILFGLLHGFRLNEQLHMQMDWAYFIYTMLFGLVFGWIVLKSRSILVPVLAHNIGNFSTVLIAMLR